MKKSSDGTTISSIETEIDVILILIIKTFSTKVTYQFHLVKRKKKSFQLFICFFLPSSKTVSNNELSVDSTFVRKTKSISSKDKSSMLRLLINRTNSLKLCSGITWSTNATTIGQSSQSVYGSDPAMFHLPTDIYIADNDYLYVLDSNNYRVQLWYPNATSAITVISATPGDSLDQFYTS